MERSFYGAMCIVIAFGLFFWYMVAHTMYDVAKEKQNTFVSDGCTMFVDRSWGACCIEHDRAYWQGGSMDTRQIVDEKFKDCMYKKTQSKILSIASYVVVRMGGVPYLATPWRWGYGWSFGREYR